MSIIIPLKGGENIETDWQSCRCVYVLRHGNQISNMYIYNAEGSLTLNLYFWEASDCQKVANEWQARRIDPIQVVQKCNVVSFHAVYGPA